MMNRYILGAMIALLLAGCVSTSDHEAVLARVDSLNSDVVGLRDAIAERDSRIKALEAQVEGLMEDKLSLTASENALIKENSDLKGRIASTELTLKKEILSLDSRLMDREAELARLAETLDERDSEVSSLKSAMNDMIALNDQVSEEKLRAMAEIKGSCEATVAELRVTCGEAISNQKTSHEAELARVRKAHNAEVGDLKRLHGEEVSLIKASHREEIGAMKATHSGELAAIKNGCADEKTALIEAYEGEIRGLADEYDEEVFTLSGSYDAAIAEYRGKYEDELTRLKGACEAEMGRIRESYSRELEQLKGTYDELVTELNSEIQSGQIEVTNLKGRLSLSLVDKVLFDSGSAEVTGEGRKVLDRVAVILKKAEGKAIRIEGHTDNVPIGPVLARKFPSNWELSTARATNVVRYLQDQGGLDPSVLGASGFGPYKPIAGNDTPEGKARNRRIEIILTPLDDERSYGSNTAPGPANGN